MFIVSDRTVWRAFTTNRGSSAQALPLRIATSRCIARNCYSSAPFFGVDHLADKLRGGTSVWDLRYCDRVLKLGAGELIDVFAVDVVERPPYELELPLLAWDCQDRPSITCGAQGFVGRIRSQLRGCLEDLLPIPGLVIASGAVTAALTGQRSNDIDIFLIGDPSDAEQKLRDVFDAIVAAAHRSDPNSRFLVLRSSFAISVYTLDGSSRIGAPIQIILNVFENILAVLEDFDLDCCCFAFDVSTQKVGGRFVDNASADPSVRVIA